MCMTARECHWHLVCSTASESYQMITNLNQLHYNPSPPFEPLRSAKDKVRFLGPEAFLPRTWSASPSDLRALECFYITNKSESVSWINLENN